MLQHSPEKRSLTERLETLIADRVRSGVYAPGKRLPSEANIAAESKVSRTVVREAISRLNAAGMVLTRHGIGSFVVEIPPVGFELDSATKVTVEDALAMLELRISLEVEAAALAAARRSAKDVAAILETLDRLSGNRAAAADTIRPDFDFHLAIAEATGNRYIVETMSRLGTATIPRNRLSRSANDPNLLDMIERQHRDVFEAIRARDPEAARMMMRVHLTASRERLRRACETALVARNGRDDTARTQPETSDRFVAASGVTG